MAVSDAAEAGCTCGGAHLSIFLSILGVNGCHELTAFSRTVTLVRTALYVGFLTVYQVARAISRASPLVYVYSGDATLA